MNEVIADCRLPIADWNSHHNKAGLKSLRKEKANLKLTSRQSAIGNRKSAMTSIGNDYRRGI
jgi:hypothetical protein